MALNLILNLFQFNLVSFSDGFTLHSTRLSLDYLDFPHPPLCKGNASNDDDDENH